MNARELPRCASCGDAAGEHGPASSFPLEGDRCYADGCRGCNGYDPEVQRTGD